VSLLLSLKRRIGAIFLTVSGFRALNLELDGTFGKGRNFRVANCLGVVCLFPYAGLLIGKVGLSSGRSEC
jgi:hypothetical protein